MIKRPLYTGIGLMLLLTLLIYLNHFNNSFHFDDFHTVLNNAAIRSLKNTPKFFTDGRTSSVLPQNQAYRPVTVLSLAIDYWLAGGNYASYFQTSTFILFLIQGVLIVFLFKNIFERSFLFAPNSSIALFAASWYMLHPANAETVNYIIARTDVQSTLFMLLGLVLYIYSPFCRKTFIYLLPVGVGALCKPPAVMFAPILFVYVLFFDEKTGFNEFFRKDGLKKFLAVFRKTLPAFIFCAALYLFIDRMTPKTWQPGGSSPTQYLITQPFVILHYFCQFFLPNGLSADTDWKVLPSIWDIRFFAGCAFILVMLAIAFYTSKKTRLRPISFGITWFFLALIPSSSIIPLGEVLNDHRMYFPFIGLAMSVSWSLGLLYVKYQSKLNKTLVAGIIAFGLAAYAFGTFQRNEVWRSEKTLWHDVTIKSPNNGRGMMNYALALYDEYDLNGAKKYLKKAEKIAPEYAAVYTNLGLVIEMQGDIALAENYYKEGVRLGPGYPDSYTFYARYLIKQWRFADALPLLQKAVRLSPTDFDAWQLLMTLYSMTTDWDKLRVTAMQAATIFPQNNIVADYLEAAAKKVNELDIEDEKIRLHPDADDFMDLSMRDYQMQRYVQSINAAQEALKLNPRRVDAYNNIGASYIKLWQPDKATGALNHALAIDPDFALAKNNLEQIDEFKKAGANGLNVSADAYINLSLYYYNNQRYQDCINACNQALSLMPGSDLAYNNICASYIKLGKYDEAIIAAKKGLESNPGNPLLRNNLADAEKAQAREK